MESYINSAQNQNPKTVVLDAMNEFREALTECRRLIDQNPELRPIFDLLLEGVNGVEAIIAREWNT